MLNKNKAVRLQELPMTKTDVAYDKEHWILSDQNQLDTILSLYDTIRLRFLFFQLLIPKALIHPLLKSGNELNEISNICSQAINAIYKLVPW